MKWLSLIMQAMDLLLNSLTFFIKKPKPPIPKPGPAPDYPLSASKTSQGPKPMDKTTALNTISDALEIPSEWLSNLIQFESGWNPLARNPISGARGLIQFTHTTAKGLGYVDADDLVSRYPDAGEQLLGPVYMYLIPMKPFPTKQSLYMAVFYPAARNWDITQPFSAAIQALNPGIKTVEDYIKKVEGSSTTKIVALVALALVGSYFFYKNFIEGAKPWQEKQVEIVRKV